MLLKMNSNFRLIIFLDYRITIAFFGMMGHAYLPLTKNSEALDLHLLIRGRVEMFGTVTAIYWPLGDPKL